MVIMRVLLLIALTGLIFVCGCAGKTADPAMPTSSPAPVSASFSKTPVSTNADSLKSTGLAEHITIARAAAIIDYTLEDLIKHTDTAVFGKVIEKLPAKQDEYKSPQIYVYTDVIIHPERYLYGKSRADRIAIRVDGGRIGDIGMSVEDESEFTLGEECFVFLTHLT
jgi:hypothetical protein